MARLYEPSHSIYLQHFLESKELLHHQFCRWSLQHLIYSIDVMLMRYLLMRLPDVIPSASNSIPLNDVYSMGALEGTCTPIKTSIIISRKKMTINLLQISSIILVFKIEMMLKKSNWTNMILYLVFFFFLKTKYGFH